MSNRAEKLIVNIRMPKFIKLVFDSYMSDLQLRRGESIFTSDAFFELLKNTAPEHIEKVRKLHPDLYEEFISDVEGD